MVARFSARRAPVALIAKLAHHVDVRCANAGVNARPFGFGESFPASLDVLRHGARQTADGRAMDLLRDLPHSLEVIWRRSGIAGFNDVHLQLGQLPGDGELFLTAEARSGRLLTVSQRRIEDCYLVGRHC